MKTLKDLIDTCTIIIWVGSALHAAVNFRQYTYAGYIPNRPAISRRFMSEPSNATYEELKRHNRVDDRRGTVGGLGRFGKELGEIENEIVDMDRDEKLKNSVGSVKVPYTLLFPTSESGLTGKGIPNSDSI
ncbi:hypothetical protein Vadar_016044 [Vaccinium darrowii]|uniref:Uncharacterized protein n=1 Tax=Vaccinium darrowii TaxID=229202 RepID=A0ACB7Y100_9ERIC|nr:hypothetical protein Vadar_016044 [Vaccinium darrowii]